MPLVTKILDSASQKGTGKWTAVNALDLGMPVTLIGEAVFARCLSSIKEERVRASKVLAGPQIEPFSGDKKQFIDDLEQALYASKVYVRVLPLLLSLADRLLASTASPTRRCALSLPLFGSCVACLTPVRTLGLHAHARGRCRVQVEPQLCRHCSHVARRMHHQEVRDGRVGLSNLCADARGLQCLPW